MDQSLLSLPEAILEFCQLLTLAGDFSFPEQSRQYRIERDVSGI